MDRFGCRADEVVRAYLAVRDVFALRGVWTRIEAQDGKVSAKTQISMLIEVNRLLERGMAWVLAHVKDRTDIGGLLTGLAPRIDVLRAAMGRFLPPGTESAIAARADDYRAQGVPDDLSCIVSEMILLAAAPDIALIASKAGRTEEDVAAHYFLVNARFGLGFLRAAAERLPRGSHWQKRAIEAVIDDLYGHQAALTHRVVETGLPPDQALEIWSASRRTEVERAEQLLGELRTTGTPDLATLVVASYQIRKLAEG
jgi:glutamate dehydrogenase